jgi:pimeloyl-ACP methyl ester carboxylesterase
MKLRLLIALALAVSSVAQAKSIELPAALTRDPPANAAHPAAMEVLHVTSGGDTIFGIAYLAAGAGPHPTVVIAHGWPGNEKNLDLAQAARRAGWNAVTFNYRGSWGSGGNFRMGNNPQDAAAVIAYLRASPDKLRVDPSRIAIIGHSMGGWVSALAAQADPRLLGAGLISAANLGSAGALPRADLIELANGNSETLAGTSPEAIASELMENRAAYDFLSRAAALANRPLLVLSSDDGLAPQSDALIAAVRAAGGNRITAAHVATDHGWNGRRIELTARVLHWLETLAPPEPEAR